MILLFLYLPQSKYVEPSMLHNSAMPLHSPHPNMSMMDMCGWNNKININLLKFKRYEKIFIMPDCPFSDAVCVRKYIRCKEGNKIYHIL